MEVLHETIIDKWIVPYLSAGKLGAKSGVSLSAVVATVFHCLKSGGQWRMLSVKEYFEADVITWRGVY